MLGLASTFRPRVRETRAPTGNRANVKTRPRGFPGTASRDGGEGRAVALSGLDHPSRHRMQIPIQVGASSACHPIAESGICRMDLHALDGPRPILG